MPAMTPRMSRSGLATALSWASAGPARSDAATAQARRIEQRMEASVAGTRPVCAGIRRLQRPDGSRGLARRLDDALALRRFGDHQGDALAGARIEYNEDHGILLNR